MARKDARVLRDEVADAIDRGKFKKALECIVELEQLEPRDASWPKRAAEVYRRLGKTREAVAAYERAVDRYAQGGFLIQAIAVCKQILQLDPTHSGTLHRLSEMTELRQTSPTGVAAFNVAADAIPELTISRNTGPIPLLDPATIMAPDRVVDMLEMPEAQRRRATAVTFNAPIAEPEAELELDPAYGEQPQQFELPDPSGQIRLPPAELPRSAPRPRPVPLPPPLPGQRRGTPLTEIDPDQRVGQQPSRSSGRPPPIPMAARRRMSPLTPPRRARHGTNPIAMEKGAGIETVALSSVMPGAAAETNDHGASSGIIVIPLEDMEDTTGRIEIEALPPMSEDTFEVGLDELDTGTHEPIPSEEIFLDGIPGDGSDAEMGLPRALSAAAHRALRATPLLSGLSADALETMVERLELIHLAPDQVLFREGDAGDTLFVISEGEVAVLSEGPPRTELSRLLPGSFFGEVALITDTPRSATIQAVTRTELMAIDRDVVRDMVTQHPDVLRVILRFIRNRLVERVIQTSPLFIPFPESERRALAERCDFLEVEPGTSLITQNTRPDGLYVMLAGRAECVRELGDGAVRGLGFLGTGQVFGEMALWGSEPSLASVVARGKVLALRMPAAIFREVIMTHPQVLAYVGDLAEDRKKQVEVPEDSGDMVDLKLDLI